MSILPQTSARVLQNASKWIAIRTSLKKYGSHQQPEFSLLLLLWVLTVLTQLDWKFAHLCVRSRG